MSLLVEIKPHPRAARSQPDLIEQALAGRQPRALRLKALTSKMPPMDAPERAQRNGD